MSCAPAPRHGLRRQLRVRLQPVLKELRELNLGRRVFAHLALEDPDPRPWRARELLHFVLARARRLPSTLITKLTPAGPPRWPRVHQTSPHQRTANNPIRVRTSMRSAGLVFILRN